MRLDDLLKQTSEWLKGTGPQSKIVISSRIRLARNIERLPFSHWANKKQSEEALKLAKNSIESSAHMKDCLFLKLADLDNIDKQFLIERHLMSKEHAMEADHKAVAIGEGEGISIMVNEEDHLRIQVMRSGFDLRQAWDTIDSLDNELSDTIDYSYSTEWGYLTACPTNTGTGMRASVMLHLPALVVSKQINKVLQAITKLSLTARGLYGEGTEASGNFFQISNQVSLGQTEEDLIDNIERIIKQVIGHEEAARDSLYTNEKQKLDDRIWRAFGTLRSAHIITSAETIDHLSMVRLGIDIGVIPLDRQIINELFILTQPAHLQKIEGKKLNPAERDVKRAALIREKLGGGSK